MKKIKIDFADFWPGFKKEDNFFYNLLSAHYDLEITNDPDFLIYSVFSSAYHFYFCTRIFYTGENPRPYYNELNYNECDYSFGYAHMNDKRHYRLPLYAMFCDLNLLTRPVPSFEDILREKTKFCNIVVSNPDAKERIDFFNKLSEYKTVDSGGGFLNNIGKPVKDKMEFIREYKFTIAFENSSIPGYTTEKIVQPMLVNSIPIYWGNSLIQKDFNTKSFVNCHEYASFDEVIERIIEIDKDEELYKQYLQQTYFTDNVLNEFVRKENILEQFKRIFENQDKIIPVAKKELKSKEDIMKQLINEIIEADEAVEKLESEQAKLKITDDKCVFSKKLLGAKIKRKALVERFSNIIVK
jgi:alpha(1,3/1,4) fucosyltransferase